MVPTVIGYAPSHQASTVHRCHATMQCTTHARPSLPVNQNPDLTRTQPIRNGTTPYCCSAVFIGSADLCSILPCIASLPFCLSKVLYLGSTYSHLYLHRLVLRSSVRWPCRLCRSRHPLVAGPSSHSHAQPPRQPLPQEPPQWHWASETK